jgi:hypothetical protein
MTSIFRLAVIAILFSDLAACAVTPERHREAKLMPEKVALQIVARHTNSQWASTPTSRAHLANHPLCNDQTIYPMPYKTMSIQWDPFGVYIRGDQKVGFWCGTVNGATFKITNTQEQDDLIDALTSLGAKVNTN